MAEYKSSPYNKPKKSYGKKEARKDESTDVRTRGAGGGRKLIAAQRIYGFKNLQTNGTKDFWTYGVQKILY